MSLSTAEYRGVPSACYAGVMHQGGRQSASWTPVIARPATPLPASARASRFRVQVLNRLGSRRGQSLRRSPMAKRVLR